MLLPPVETVFLCIEYAAMCVFHQVCPLVTACFYLSQGMVNVGMVVVFSSCFQMFCFALPESLSRYSWIAVLRMRFKRRYSVKSPLRCAALLRLMISSVLGDIQGRLGVGRGRPMESAAAWFTEATKRFQSVSCSSARAPYLLEMEHANAEVMVGS